MSIPKDSAKKTLRESVEAVIDESKVALAEGKLPPWLEKKKKGKAEEEVEEAKKVVKEEECSCDEDDDLPWCDDCEEVEEAKKVVKEEECSCDEDDDLPWCDDCEDEDTEVNEATNEIGRIKRMTISGRPSDYNSSGENHNLEDRPYDKDRDGTTSGKGKFSAYQTLYRHGGNYFLVSYSTASGETMIFKANKNGKVTDWKGVHMKSTDHSGHDEFISDYLGGKSGKSFKIVKEAKKSDDESHEDEDELEEVKKPEPKKMKEHLAPLFDGQELSEDFKTKVETIFGAVISEREAAIKEHYETVLAETVASTQSDLAEKVDEYLSYVVEEWYKENKIALERSLRAEIAENFMEGLRNLFTDNFITIPDEKVDVLEAANTKIDELTLQVNEEIKNGMEKTKRIDELEAKIAFSESVAGLTLSEVEKLRGLSESIEFDTVDEFKNKLGVLKETYLKTPVQETRDTLVEDSSASPDAQLSPAMQAYTRTLAKFRN